MQQVLAIYPVPQYRPVFVNIRIIATTTDSQIAAFGTSQVAVYNNGTDTLPITSLPEINLTEQEGFPGTLAWSIEDDRLILTAFNDTPINWILGQTVDR